MVYRPQRGRAGVRVRRRLLHRGADDPVGVQPRPGLHRDSVHQGIDGSRRNGL